MHAHIWAEAKATDKAGNVITVAYFNDRGWKSSITDPDMGQWSYTYYPLAELYQQTDAKSQVTTFTYDKLSRPATRQQGGLTTTWTWGTSAGNHNIGRLASIGEAGSSWSEGYTYDSKGRLSVKTTSISGTDFALTHSERKLGGVPEKKGLRFGPLVNLSRSNAGTDYYRMEIIGDPRKPIISDPKE